MGNPLIPERITPGLLPGGWVGRIYAHDENGCELIQVVTIDPADDTQERAEADADTMLEAAHGRLTEFALYDGDTGWRFRPLIIALGIA